MTQTVSHINANDVSVWLDNDAGTLTDISGSSNSAALAFTRMVHSLRLQTSNWPIRQAENKDMQLNLKFVYSMADGEAMDLLSEWWLSGGLRTFRILMSYDGGSDYYTGEAILQSYSADAVPTNPAAILVDAVLWSSGGVRKGIWKWWDPLDDITCTQAAYQAKDADSLLASYTDLTGNGNDAVPGLVPTWNATDGWVFDADWWLDSGVTDTDGTWTAIAQFTDQSVGGALFGKTSGIGTGNFHIQFQPGAANVLYYHHNTVIAPPIMVGGNLCIAGPNCYRNGVADGVSGGFVVPLAGTIPIGAVRIVFPPVGIANFCHVKIQAFALYSCTLTATQVAAVANAMAAL